MRRSRIAPVLTLIASMAACAAPDAATTVWHTEHDTVGDTIVARTVGTTDAAAATLTQEVSIGVFEGDEAYMFGQVTAVAVAPDSSIYVYDSQAPALRKYDAAGTYVRMLGRPGGGPGEYNQATGLAVLPDGRVLLYDPGNARVSVYTAEGEPAEDWRAPGGFFSNDQLELDTAGNAYIKVILSPMTRTSDFRIGLARYSPAGVVTDTIEPPEYDYEPAKMVAVQEHGRSMTTTPFTPNVHWTLARGGYILAGLSDRYRIEGRRPDGTVLRIEKEAQPVAVLPDESDQWHERTTFMMRRTQADWRWTGPPIPDAKPFFKGIATGTDGRIWVQLYARAHDEAETEPAAERNGEPAPPPFTFVEPVVFDVFEPDGTYAGRVELPARNRLATMRGDRIWTVARDSLDVQYVKRYRIAFTGG